MPKYRARRTVRVGHNYLITDGDVFTEKELMDHCIELLTSQNFVNKIQDNPAFDEQMKSAKEMDHVTTFEERQEELAENLRITDAAKTLAIREGLVNDLLSFEGSGKDGRILKGDVQEMVLSNGES